jgi:UDP-3-O-[3-hydroxymyristoyl] glucosamine N-acyltransferase
MLLHYDNTKPVYIIGGDGISAQELYHWIKQEADAKLVDQYDPKFDQCIIGFQTLEYRIKFLNQVHKNTSLWPTYVHPMAVVSDLTLLGKGVIIHPQSVVGYRATINNYSVICQLSSIGHNAKIGINNVVSPGSVISGSAVTGNNIFFGQQSSIRDGITVCSDVFFTMNSVVTKDIVVPGKYVGNKKIK